jgi:TolB-like protein
MAQADIAFGPFRLDLVRRALLRDQIPVRLGSRAIDLLCVLAEANGAVVSKAALIERVWPREVVEENTLHVHMSALRKALAHGPDGAPIVTVQGRGYRFAAGEVYSPAAVGGSKSAAEAALPSRDHRSIAVLPFANISNDPAEDYFVDGMVEEIITGLSRIRWLSAIARNSSMSFRGKDVSLQQIGRELGARYLVEGMVRRGGDRVRISVRLVDAESGVQLWAERYDRQYGDLFALQDEITVTVIGAIEPSLRRAEVERVARKRPESLDAYDQVLRGLPHVHSHLAADADIAIPFLRKALALDPHYAAAHASLALCFHSRFSRGGLREQDRLAAVFHARASLRYGADDPNSLAMAGFVISLDEHDQATAHALFDRALEISASGVFALRFSALVMAWSGQSEIAIARALRAIELSPFDALNFVAFNALAIAQYSLQHYEASRDAALQSVAYSPEFSVSRAFLAAALWRVGAVTEAAQHAQQIRQSDPSFSVDRFGVTVAFEPRVFAPYAEAWRALGLSAPLE